MQSVRNTADRLAAKRRQDEGFTLIELLVVIVILGVLAAVVVFSVGGLTDRGQTSACKADRNTLEVALEAYRAKTGAYPVTQANLIEPANQFLRAVPTWHTSAAGIVTALPPCP